MPQQSLLFSVSCFPFSFCLALSCQSYPEAPAEATSCFWAREYFAFFRFFVFAWFCFFVFVYVFFLCFVCFLTLPNK